MAENSAADADRTHWEYETLSRKTEEYLVDDLNVAGAEGWELVSIDYHREVGGMGENMVWTAFLKRPYSGERKSRAAHERREADEIAKKKKFLTAALDDNEPEFAFQAEVQPPPPTITPTETTPSTLQPAVVIQPTADDGDVELQLEGDAGSLTLEGNDGELKLEGDDGGLKLEGDGGPELTLEDELTEADIIEADEIPDGEEERKD